MPELHEWESFYVIVGAAAGALIGLQFVVLTLIAERPSLRIAEASGAFLTPTIVHFGAVLLVSAILTAPWKHVEPPAVLWTLVGIAGAIYVGVVGRRMHLQKAYQPDLEDKMYYLVLPLIAYVTMVASGLMARGYEQASLFALAGASLLAMMAAIHNAWDGISYHVFVIRPKLEEEDKKSA